MARILVVDDSRFSRAQIVDILKELGHETVEAINGREGLAARGAGAFDCVFSDLLMPAMTGLEMLAALRSAGDAIPVVVCSADIQDSSRKLCRELRAIAFVTKPIKRAAVAAAIEAALAPGAVSLIQV